MAKSFAFRCLADVEATQLDCHICMLHNEQPLRYTESKVLVQRNNEQENSTWLSFPGGCSYVGLVLHKASEPQGEKSFLLAKFAMHFPQ